MKAEKLIEKFSLQDVANTVESEFEDYFADRIGKGCNVDILIVENESDDEMFDIIVEVKAKKILSEEVAETLVDSIEEKLFELLLSVWDDDEVDVVRERVFDKKVMQNGSQIY